ncbi:MAG: single-stranded-DNA-specific exonuclease RecJ [Ruminococcaceae bacterium]|nr:single-stranded-DNA-specific exonuclease RecJ [Oscillospiraceae bacterium]
MQNKKWKFRVAVSRQEEVLRVSRVYSIPPIVATILLKRGIENLDEFLIPTVDKLHDPFLMRDMDKAVTRIVQAISQGERIVVYGDYDVDGITSTAIITRFLRARGAEVVYHIPDRLQEGYGVNIQALDKLSAEGATLMITVDCGITAVGEVAHAKELGMDVIVTDHHECKDELPDAVAVINPKRPDCSYPFKQLAGVGVAFKLLQALSVSMRIHNRVLLEEYLDITAIGTVADVMPLVGENRILAKNGLEQIAYTGNKGICALARRAELDLRHITASTIGFMLAPRINAAGRVGDPKCAVELLLADTEKAADAYAEQLDNINRFRQTEEHRIFEEAMTMLTEDPSYAEDSVLVLSKKGWQHGIIGIVASKITERFYKPCILISLDGEDGKGSGRSIKQFNLFVALSACDHELVKFGGHELAAGLTVEADKIPSFRRAINAYAKSVLDQVDCVPEITIDAELPLAYMNLHTVDKLSIMEPYGMENGSPIFICQKLCVVGIRSLSEGRHVRLQLSDGVYFINAIGFSMGDLAEKVHLHDYIDIVFTLDTNIYRGERQIQVILKDVKPSSMDV